MFTGNTSTHISNHYSRKKIVLDHQGLLFTSDSITLSWRTVQNFNNSAGYYQLTVHIQSSCDVSSNVTLISETQSNSFVLRRDDLVGEGNSSPHFTLCSTDQNSSELCLENFQLKLGSELGCVIDGYLHACKFYFVFFFIVITEDLTVCNSSVITPTCTKAPALNGRQTLILAVPSLSACSQSRQDILCPVHPHLNERCVDLLSCNNFNETVFTNSLSICKTVDFDTSLELEMCFHNVTEAMNGTKLHLFHSKLQCVSSVGGGHPSTRIYAKAIQLKTSMT